MIPENYAEWRHCIEQKCGIKLTGSYVQQRIEELRNEQHPHTRDIIKLYGRGHWENLLQWFQLSLPQ